MTPEKKTQTCFCGAVLDTTKLGAAYCPNCELAQTFGEGLGDFEVLETPRLEKKD